MRCLLNGFGAFLDQAGRNLLAVTTGAVYILHVVEWAPHFGSYEIHYFHSSFMEFARTSSVELTRMLKAWSTGDHSALEQLTPVVYSELHRLARRNFAREREGHLLQPSALVNEAFLRLMDGAPTEWASRMHFFAFSSRLMRQILIDFARAQDTGKRGHRITHVDLSHVGDLAREQASPVDLLDLDAALNALAKLHERQAQVVELRYFGGLENPEIAAVLGISEPTVVRDWRVARAWLYDRLQSQDERQPTPERPGGG